jgi:hypothetical protein
VVKTASAAKAAQERYEQALADGTPQQVDAAKAAVDKASERHLQATRRDIVAAGKDPDLYLGAAGRNDEAAAAPRAQRAPKASTPKRTTARRTKPRATADPTDEPTPNAPKPATPPRAMRMPPGIPPADEDAEARWPGMSSGDGKPKTPPRRSASRAKKPDA